MPTPRPAPQQSPKPRHNPTPHRPPTTPPFGCVCDWRKPERGLAVRCGGWRWDAWSSRRGHMPNPATLHRRKPNPGLLRDRAETQNTIRTTADRKVNCTSRRRLWVFVRFVCVRLRAQARLLPALTPAHQPPRSLLRPLPAHRNELLEEYRCRRSSRRVHSHLNKGRARLLRLWTRHLQRHPPHRCISRESSPGHIDGNDVFYH